MHAFGWAGEGDQSFVATEPLGDQSFQSARASAVDDADDFGFEAEFAFDELFEEDEGAVRGFVVQVDRRAIANFCTKNQGFVGVHAGCFGGRLRI